MVIIYTILYSIYNILCLYFKNNWKYVLLIKKIGLGKTKRVQLVG